MAMSINIKLSYDNYTGKLPADTVKSVGKSFVIGSVVSSLISLNLDKGLYVGALFGLAALIRALTTPIFKENFPAPSKLDQTSRTLAEIGKTAINLTILYALTGAVNPAVILPIATISAIMRTVLFPELIKIIKRDLGCSHPLLKHLPKNL